MMNMDLTTLIMLRLLGCHHPPVPHRQPMTILMQIPILRRMQQNQNLQAPAYLAPIRPHSVMTLFVRQEAGDGVFAVVELGNEDIMVAEEQETLGHAIKCPFPVCRLISPQVTPRRSINTRNTLLYIPNKIHRAHCPCRTPMQRITLLRPRIFHSHSGYNHTSTRGSHLRSACQCILPRTLHLKVMLALKHSPILMGFLKGSLEPPGRMTGALQCETIHHIRISRKPPSDIFWMLQTFP